MEEGMEFDTFTIYLSRGLRVLVFLGGGFVGFVKL